MTTLTPCHMASGRAHGMEAGSVTIRGWYSRHLEVGGQAPRPLTVVALRHIPRLTMQPQWLRYFLKISIVNLKCLRKRGTNGQPSRGGLSSLVRAVQW